MKFKKIIASALCVSVLTGLAGCDTTKKDREAISKVIDECAEAFRNDDFEAFADLTNMKKKDKAYQQAENAMGGFDFSDEYYTDCYDLIFDTIEIHYDTDDIKVDGKKASVAVKYEVMDWDEVVNKVYDLYIPYEDAIKNTDETKTIKAKMEFELEDGEWKISDITKIDELFAFKGIVNPPDYIPTPAPDPTDTDPAVTEPTDTQPTDTQPVSPSGTNETTAFADSYEKAIAAYILILEQYRDDIYTVESTHTIDPVGLYDIDGNGLPELFFISDDGNGYSSTFHVFEYKEYAGEAIEVITSPEIVTTGQVSGFMVYLTDKELIITYEYGETFFLHVSTDVYAIGERDGGYHKWDLCESYARETVVDYDPASDEQTVEKLYYHNALSCTEDIYMPAMKNFTERTVIQLARKFVLNSNDPEYGLMSKPTNQRFSYSTMHDYLESLIA